MFEQYVGLINEYLEQIVPPEDAQPEPIYRAMRYSLFAGGKRLRPLLCLAATETLGEQPRVALPVAAAVEMIHTYSLIHDDLPCMDNDDFRRGKPTNHKVFGEAIAVLAGDALLTFALETLSRAPYKPEIICHLLQLLTEAAGPGRLIGGQVIDIVSENKTLTRIELEKLHGMKTGSLIAFSVMAPAVVLEAGKDAEQTLYHYGQKIGLAFQIVDDVLDVEGQTEILGKTAGKDHDSHKATYPSLLGLEESKALASELTAQAIESVAPYDRLSHLTVLAHHILERKK